jgi:hypothetical protein
LRIPERVNDETALLRYLMYGLLPAWLIPSLLDWNQHRRSRIEVTSGTRESLIYLLMMAEVGLPLTMVLVCEVNPLVLSTIAASIAAHEATALWDVSTAEDSGREVTPFEQHVHSFLESMPIMAASALGCLRWRQVRDLLDGARSRDAWRLRWKQKPAARRLSRRCRRPGRRHRGSLRRRALPLRHQGGPHPVLTPTQNTHLGGSVMFAGWVVGRQP